MTLTVLTEDVVFSAKMEKDGVQELVEADQVETRLADGWKLIEPSKTLVVSQENWHIAMLLSRVEDAARIQYLAEQKQAEDSTAKPDPNDQYFHVIMYPRLSTAVIEGDVPSAEDAMLMPSRELDKWFMAVKRLNPQWFPVESESPQTQEEAEALSKKKARKRVK